MASLIVAYATLPSSIFLVGFPRNRSNQAAPEYSVEGEGAVHTSQDTFDLPPWFCTDRNSPSSLLILFLLQSQGIESIENVIPLHYSLW